ncbi:divergent polysaccharide deacetylase family protein [Catenovulum sp. SM1970]|uniref:divergent polysaccharide deacetylase family protein n=1 Tax=Marinifaba aquimaris TaxID=2741323 RepID=UPI001572DB31|nr:divergent polysaccharide deacetylase family protein [Marinifaba aquimaris]NTS77235.1 divergent polysaccharide deacetylase family protein [Marinifaba aquimaris]
MTRFISAAFCFLALLITSVNAAEIAVIIDDIGYKKSDVQVLALPQEVTIAVLPHTPHGNDIARKAAVQGREVMLHIPMESLAGLKLGPGGLVSDMSEQAMRQQIALNIESLPFVVGVNNHMGSKLTQMYQPMKVLMQELAKNDLYFVDSRTTRFTLAEGVAKEFGIKHWRRDVFLDAEQTEAFVRKQFAQLLRTAKRTGFAVAIGHPYPETIKVLTEEFAKLDQQISIARVSKLPVLKATERYALLPSNAQQVIAD